MMPQVPWEKSRIWIWDATHFPDRPGAHRKKNAELFTDADYKKHVRDLGADYLSRTPRPVAT